MREPARIACLVALAALLAAPTAAEELIYFTDGKVMPVRSHNVEEGMVHVDMGENNFMAFPMDMVDRIEKAGQDVYLRPSVPSNSTGGVKIAVDRSESYPVFGHRPDTADGSAWQKLRAQPDLENPRVEVDDKGVATIRPYGKAGARGRFRVSGNNAIFGQSVITDPREGLVGTTKVGTRNVMGGVVHPRMRQGRPPVVGLQPNPDSGAAPLPPKPPAESAQDTAPPADSGSDP